MVRLYANCSQPRNLFPTIALQCGKRGPEKFRKTIKYYDDNAHRIMRRCGHGACCMAAADWHKEC